MNAELLNADLLSAVAAATLCGSLAIAAVLVLRRPFRRAFGAQVAYAAWILVPLAVVAILLPGSGEPALTRWLVAASPESALAATLRPHAVAPSAWPAPAAALLATWGLGAVLMAGWYAWQQCRYRRSLGRLHDLGGLLRAESTQVGPALVGGLRPRIVVPADFEERYDPAERELILAHESIHLARRDAQVNALVAGLRCLNWFNPVVHLAAARFRLDQELACDESVMERFPKARRRYADAMLKAQLAGQAAQEPFLPAGCSWSRHPLQERITLLGRPAPPPLRRWFGLSLAVAISALGSYAAWETRPVHAAASPVHGYTGISFRFRIADHDPTQLVEIETGQAFPSPEAGDGGLASTPPQAAPDSGASAPPAVQHVARFYQAYGRPTYIRYGSGDDRREIVLTVEPEGEALRVRTEYTRRGERMEPVERTVADDQALNLRDAAGQAHGVDDGVDDVTFQFARARVETPPGGP